MLRKSLLNVSVIFTVAIGFQSLAFAVTPPSIQPADSKKVFSGDEIKDGDYAISTESNPDGVCRMLGYDGATSGSMVSLKVSKKLFGLLTKKTRESSVRLDENGNPVSHGLDKSGKPKEEGILFDTYRTGHVIGQIECHKAASKTVAVKTPVPPTPPAPPAPPVAPLTVCNPPMQEYASSSGQGPNLCCPAGIVPTNATASSCTTMAATVSPPAQGNGSVSLNDKDSTPVDAAIAAGTDSLQAGGNI